MNCVVSTRNIFFVLCIFVYKHKPLSKDRAYEYAQALVQCARSMDRAEKLLGGLATDEC